MVGGAVIWFGEEDQLRIMCMKTGTRLDEVFTRLRQGLDTIESIKVPSLRAASDTCVTPVGRNRTVARARAGHRVRAR